MQIYILTDTSFPVITAMSVSMNTKGRCPRSISTQTASCTNTHTQACVCNAEYSNAAAQAALPISGM